MRQITTLADERLAQRFADHLLTLGIETRLLDEPDGVGVWARDEDRLAEARRELEAFQRDPADARFAQAETRAKAIRQSEDAAEREYETLQRRSAAAAARVARGTQPVLTALLMAASVAATVWMGMDNDTPTRAQEMLSIAKFEQRGGWVFWDGLDAVNKGEVWRLVTPIFLHFSPLHLIFNMIMLYQLGGPVEVSRGVLKYALFVLFLAVSSNFAEYHMQISLAKEPWFELRPSPMFGGMSGVVYGLFGYVWMKGRYEPELGLVASPQNVVIMLVWLVVCMTGALGPIANVAHAAGLLGGVAVGAAPAAWRSLLRRGRGLR